MTTCLLPHDFEGGNVKRIPINKNPQKTRKPNADPALRANSYWDLRGRWQREYDERLDALPDEGPADTVGGEIFRAATKLYYDFYNNAMVNNTSGAINYLADVGVLLPTVRGDDKNNDDEGIFETVHPYTIGSEIYFSEERGLFRVMERMLDRTIDFLRARPELGRTPNEVDHHDLRDADARGCAERCAIRNRRAKEAGAVEAARRTNTGVTKSNAREIEGERARRDEKAQDHCDVGSRRLPLKSLTNKKNVKNKNRKNGRTKKKAAPAGSKSQWNQDVAAKFSKLGLFD